MWLRFLGAGLAVGQSHVKLYLTKTYELYVANVGDEDLTMSASELCGFGLGAFNLMVTGLFLALLLPLSVDTANPHLWCQPTLAGLARSNTKTSFPWVLNSDADLVVSVANGSKTVTTVADIACDESGRNGIMEFACHDYDMVQKTKAWLLLSLFFHSIKFKPQLLLHHVASVFLFAGRWLSRDLALPAVSQDEDQYLHPETFG